MPNGRETYADVEAPFTKYTPKQLRFTGKNREGISVSVYIPKGQDIPDIVRVTITQAKK